VDTSLGEKLNITINLTFHALTCAGKSGGREGGRADVFVCCSFVVNPPPLTSPSLPPSLPPSLFRCARGRHGRGRRQSDASGAQHAQAASVCGGVAYRVREGRRTRVKNRFCHSFLPLTPPSLLLQLPLPRRPHRFREQKSRRPRCCCSLRLLRFLLRGLYHLGEG